MKVGRRVKVTFSGTLHLGHHYFARTCAREYGFAPQKPVRPIAGTDDADMGIANSSVLVQVEEDGNSGKGKIASPEGKLLESPSAGDGPGRKANCHNEFVVGKCGRQCSGYKFRRGHLAVAILSFDLNSRVTRYSNARHFGCRIGMGKASAHRTPIADLVMRHV